MRTYLSFKKLSLLILSSFFMITFLTTFQNCQQAQFSSKVLKLSIPLELSLTSSPVNSINCNDGLKVTIEKRGDFFAEAPYSFDGGKTWGISNFAIYTQTTVIDIGEIMVMDSNNNTISNTRAYKVDMISCNLNVGLSCIAPPGSYCPAGSGTHQTCSAGYTCAGGLAQPQVCMATPGYYCPVGSTEAVVCPVDKTCAGGVNQPVSATSGSTQIVGVCKNSTPLGCSSGAAIADNGQSPCNTTRTWYCSGQNGGANSVLCSYSNVSCNAQSTAGVCNNGTPAGCLIGSVISDTNQTTCGTARTWYCSGQNGGSNSLQCSFANASCAQPIAGTCNNSVAGGCIAGSPIQDNNQTVCGTTRTWYCSGQNGGANSSLCSLANTTCAQPINGSCSNTTPAGCVAGVATSDNNETACGTTRTWYCSGQNGGSPSASCSYSNQACAQPICSQTIETQSASPNMSLQTGSGKLLCVDRLAKSTAMSDSVGTASVLFKNGFSGDMTVIGNGNYPTNISFDKSISELGVVLKFLANTYMFEFKNNAAATLLNYGNISGPAPINVEFTDLKKSILQTEFALQFTQLVSGAIYYDFPEIQTTCSDTTSGTCSFPGTITSDTIYLPSLSQFKPGWSNNFDFLKIAKVFGGGGADTYYIHFYGDMTRSERSTYIYDTEGADVIHLNRRGFSGVSYECAKGSTATDAIKITAGKINYVIPGANHFQYRLDTSSEPLSWDTFKSRLGITCQ